MNCRVCGTELRQAYGTCSYCGYSNVALMDVHSDNSANYRDTLLNHIQKITAMTRCFHYDEESGRFIEKGEISMFLAPFEGISCYRRPVYSDYCLSHFEGTVNLIIFYEAAGKKQELTVPVRFDEQEGLWRLGLCINQKLRLEVWRWIEPLSNSEQEYRQTRLTIVDLIFPPSGKRADSGKPASYRL